KIQELFTLLGGISEEKQKSYLIEKSIHVLVKYLQTVLLEKSLTNEEIFPTLSFYFKYLKEYTQNYDDLVQEFNSRLGYDDFIFDLWVKIRYFEPKTDFLKKHLNKMQVDDYRKSPTS